MQQQRVTDEETGELEATDTLVTLAADMSNVEDVFDATDDPEGLELMFNTYMDSQAKFTDKLEKICGIIGKCKSRVAFRKEEAKRLSALAKVDDNKVNALMSYMKYAFIKPDGSVLPAQQTPHYKVSLQNNGGVAPVDVFDADKVPTRYKQFQIDGNVLVNIRCKLRIAEEGIEQGTEEWEALQDAYRVLDSLPVTGIPLTPIRDALDPPKGSPLVPVEVPGAQLLQRGQSIRIK